LTFKNIARTKSRFILETATEALKEEKRKNKKRKIYVRIYFSFKSGTRYRWFQFSRKFQVAHSSNGKGKHAARYEVKTYSWLADVDAGRAYIRELI